MGYMQDGVWVDGPIPTTDGAFVREESVFQQQVLAEEIVEDPRRFDLYVSLACPWAHRTLIFRHLKGLEKFIDVHVVDAYMGDEGWVFSKPEPNMGAGCVHQLYAKSDRQYTGRVTVPILWDKKTSSIRNNESSDIIRMLNDLWNEVALKPELDFMPTSYASQIEELNDYIYESINNGVYRTGFATEQSIYEKECQQLFAALDDLEARLEGRDYLLGDVMLEADIRLFVTLVRFDWVYVGHFKCNIRQIRDYPNLYGHMKRIYVQVAPTVDREHIQMHYYQSHPQINPNGIVPIGPETDYSK